MVIDFALRLRFGVGLVPRGRIQGAYGVPPPFPGVCAVSMRIIFRKVPPRRRRICGALTSILQPILVARSPFLANPPCPDPKAFVVKHLSDKSAVQRTQ